jgi:23S rRNA (guanosine2251-2'-O)-methyltransferase
MRSSRSGSRKRNEGRGPSPRTRSESEHELPSDLIYGLIPIVEALRAGRRQIEQITIAEGARPERLRELLELAKNARVPIHRVPRHLLSRGAVDSPNQGVMARVAAARYKDAEDLVDELSAKIGTDDPPLALGLDGIEDPECSGVHGVFTPERRSVGLNETVAKAAAGALEYVPVARVTNLVRLIEQLKERNIWVVGASADGDSVYTDWNWTAPTVLFLGSEGAGLHRLVKEKCDALVRIPIHGRLDSLNVSVAAGVLLYEAQRQRTNARKSH